MSDSRLMSRANCKEAIANKSLVSTEVDESAPNSYPIRQASPALRGTARGKDVVKSGGTSRCSQQRDAAGRGYQ